MPGKSIAQKQARPIFLSPSPMFIRYIYAKSSQWFLMIVYPAYIGRGGMKFDVVLKLLGLRNHRVSFSYIQIE